jgi:threonine/homoserine/homoserine lactone efflux protein
MPAYLQAKRGSHIVITTIMFNFIASALLVYLLVNVFRVEGSMAPESARFAEAVHLPSAADFAGFLGFRGSTPLNFAFFIAIICCVLVWILIWRTRLGYEIRAFGHSETAAVYAGINPTKIIMITMLISGGLSGMMAINVVMGEAERLVLDFTEGAGFVGIAVALMGRSHPVGVSSPRCCSARSTRAGRSFSSRCRRQPRDDRRDPGPRDPVHRRARQHGPHADGESLPLAAPQPRGGRPEPGGVRRMDTLLLYLPGFMAAYAILLVGASSPGPAVAMLMGLSLQQGRTPALIACAGIACGSATINVLTLLGVGLVLSQAAWAMVTLKLVGAAYLAWLAWGAFRKALHPPRIEAARVAPQRAPALFRKGYLLQVTNPKAIAFWLAISALATTDGAPTGVLAFFVASMAAISFACHAAWALALSANPVRAAYTRARAWIEGALGAFFAFAAVTLATSRS